ncbi:related to transposase (partial length) [Desulfotalea psychrophila LSv54]|uniref:Related to transposase (Partial length) n=1 Tax=Desulfotalea psychrophila (strain LSv54 / DSM 12343) TaxID=177439 RepID=Q6APD3_DESPS|nr:related to transposase (partial length) [Desulfotalea psychrophila LSv54]
MTTHRADIRRFAGYERVLSYCSQRCLLIHVWSLTETAMYRYKQLICDKLSLREYGVPAARAAIKALNKITALGMPVREAVC